MEQGHAQGARVAGTDRQSARELDPTAYLEASGYTVKREGRHLSVKADGDEAYRVTRHHAALSAVNPCAPDHACDEALRCALTWLLTGDEVPPPVGTDAALRYVRDRVNVPRDMSVWAGARRSRRRHSSPAMERAQPSARSTAGTRTRLRSADNRPHDALMTHRPDHCAMAYESRDARTENTEAVRT